MATSQGENMDEKTKKLYESLVESIAVGGMEACGTSMINELAQLIDAAIEAAFKKGFEAGVAAGSP